MPDPTPTAFGLTLQLLRQQQEMSLNGLGKLAGVDPAYLWRLERGEKSDPSLSILRRICRGLGIAPQEFLTRLLVVETALEEGTSPMLPPLGAELGQDPDALIFAEVLSERRQKQQLRTITGQQWNQIQLGDLPKAGVPRTVPLRGRIAAGTPVLVEEQEPEGWLEVTGSGLPRDPALFALTIEGDSMLGAGIGPEDIVLISPALTATMAGGQVGVCRLFGEELTLKHVWRTHTGYLLRAANPRYPDREVPFEACDILGVVVRVLGAARTGSLVNSPGSP